MKKSYFFGILTCFRLVFGCKQNNEEPIKSPNEQELVSKTESNLMDRMSTGLQSLLHLLLSMAI